jgi:dienelactone hydrolase
MYLTKQSTSHKLVLMSKTDSDLTKSALKRPSLLKRLIKRLPAIVLFGFAAIAVFVVLLLLDHNRETALPNPTGSFAVGRTTYVWDDAAHADPMAPPPGAKRELLAWIWYPASPPPSQTPDDYLPAPWRNALDRRGPVITILTRDLSRVRGHSFRDAQLAPRQTSYPVVFMRAGLAALTTDYTSLAEDLASHGYVVVGFDAPYRSWIVVQPDGKVIARAPQNNADLFAGPEQERLAAKLVETWAADTRFALDQIERLNASDPSGRFQGRLDLQRVGMFGHSLGGATSLQFCHDDSRCKAGIDIDGAPLGSVVAEGVTKPFMFILSAQIESSDSESRKVQADIKSIYDRLPPDERLNLEIRGANHYLFSDDGALLKSRVITGVLRTLGVVGIDGRRQIAVTAYCVHSFFDAYLKGSGVAKLKISSPLYPEIRILE